MSKILTAENIVRNLFGNRLGKYCRKKFENRRPTVQWFNLVITFAIGK